MARPRARPPACARRGRARAPRRGARGAERPHGRGALVPRAGIYDHYVPSVADVVLARRVPDRVHAVPAGDEPGRAAGDLRVPDGRLRADRDGRGERVRLRRHHRRRGRVLRRQARGPRSREGRARGDAEPAGAPGREDVRAGVRARGRRGAARERDDRSRTAGGSRRRGRRALPAAELPRLPRAGAEIAQAATEAGALAVAHVDPMSLGVLEAPGSTAARSLSARASRRATGRRTEAPTTASRGEERVHAADARAHRRRDRRPRRAPRVRAHAPDARAAHPPREGDLEHHDEPDPARARRPRDALVARAPGAARGGGGVLSLAQYARERVPLEPAFDAGSFKEVAFRRRFRRARSCAKRASAACTPGTRSGATTRGWTTSSSSRSPRGAPSRTSTASRMCSRRCAGDRPGSAWPPAPLLFERSRPVDARAVARRAGPPCPELPESLRRSRPPRLPRAPEPELVRHFTTLADRTFGVDTGFYPLGSCTMKHNPRLHERLAAPGSATSTRTRRTRRRRGRSS